MPVRKYIIVFFLFLLALSLYGCFSSPEDNNIAVKDKQDTISQDQDFATQQLAADNAKKAQQVFVDTSKTDDGLGNMPIKGTMAYREKMMTNLPAGTIKVPVLMYHHIRPITAEMTEAYKGVSITPEQFEQQLKYIKDNGFTSISLDQMANGLNGTVKLPAKPVVITFDDGYRDFYTNAFPILKKYNIHTVHFLITSYFDSPAYMTKDMIKEISKSGIVEFQSHSVTHPFLTKSTAVRLKNEVVNSKKDIEDLTGKTVKYFAYPYGDLNYGAVMQALKDAGYVMAFTIHPEYLHWKKYMLLQDRITMYYKDTLSAFARKIEVF